MVEVIIRGKGKKYSHRVKVFLSKNIILVFIVFYSLFSLFFIYFAQTNQKKQCINTF